MPMRVRGTHGTPTIEPSTDLAEGAAPGRLVDLIRSGAVLCSHGDVLGRLIRRLAAEGAPVEATIAKGGMWCLETEAGRITVARYTTRGA